MNIRVFSTHFIESSYNYLLGTKPYLEDIKRPTLSQALKIWSEKACGHFCPELFMSFHPENEIADKHIFNSICANYELHKIEKWAVENILLQLRKDWKIKTRNVKLRIVSSMLTKLENSNNITHEENVYMFNNIVNNMRELCNDLLDEELPF